MNSPTNATPDLASHPMYSPSDLAYLRGKGYTDDEILSIWDHGWGKSPVHDGPIPDYIGRLFGTPAGDESQPTA